MSYPSALGIPTYLWSTSAAGNSKSLIIPPTFKYTLLYGSIGFVANATLGSRVIRLSVYDTDGTTLLWFWTHISSQLANTTYNYPILSGQGGGRKDLSDQTGYNINIPSALILYPGWKVEVKDVTNVSATDTLSTSILFATVPIIR